MRRRVGWTVMGCLGLTLSLAGCETHRPWLRPRDGDEGSSRAVNSDSSTAKIPGVDSDSTNPQSFFKNDRRSGGWSSEARSIERDLGVGS
jgi:hypothetical protein